MYPALLLLFDPIQPQLGFLPLRCKTALFAPNVPARLMLFISAELGKPS